ncbi:glutathione S-transferase family protein [Pseudoalteromonas sp. T1lg65]|uniref:glutathione S-transferase family protein n=1 Tax=Pseudoalteromonas sp. T1lg65 TaxID=2077101 RepID=UPI003F79593E
MYTLYHFPISCSNAVKIVLEIVNVEHQVVIVDLLKGEQYQPEFLALNPTGKVPVLVTGSQIMTQGTAILIHLSQKFPKSALMPDLASKEGMAALKWLDFVATSLHGNFDKVIHPERIANDINIVKANAEDAIIKQLNQIEEQLKNSDFLAGNVPTLADYYFVVMLGWSKMLSFDLFSRYPIFMQFKTRLKSACPGSESLRVL